MRGEFHARVHRQQVSGDVRPLVPEGVHQRGVAGGGGRGVHEGARLHQRPDGVQVAALDRLVQGGGPGPAVRGEHVAAGRDQLPYDVRRAQSGRGLQGRQTCSGVAPVGVAAVAQQRADLRQVARPHGGQQPLVQVGLERRDLAVRVEEHLPADDLTLPVELQPVAVLDLEGHPGTGVERLGVDPGVGHRALGDELPELVLDDLGLLRADAERLRDRVAADVPSDVADDRVPLVLRQVEDDGRRERRDDLLEVAAADRVEPRLEDRAGAPGVRVCCHASCLLMGEVRLGVPAGHTSRCDTGASRKVRWKKASADGWSCAKLVASTTRSFSIRQRRTQVMSMSPPSPVSLQPRCTSTT